MRSSNTIHRSARRRIRPALIAALCTGFATVSLIAAGGSLASASAKASSKPTLVIWYDTARKAMIQAYIKAHPNVNVDAVLKDGDTNGDGTYQSAFALFNRVGHGWPDVYFSEQNNDAASLAQPPFNDAAALNTGLVPNSVLSQFAHGSSGLCTIGGKVYCLRNDLAMNVLWYNPALMKQDGITHVPTTWQQWAADGKLAAAHGDIIGTQGDSWDADTYYWGNECPLSDRTSQYSIVINPASTNCTKMASLLDGVSRTALPVAYMFSSTFGSTYGGKIVFYPGAAWMGGVFPGLGKCKSSNPDCTMAAGYPPTWGSGGPNATGAIGGGLWFVSSHSQNLKLAASAAEWFATDATAQAQLSPGYPAYGPDDAAWVATQAASGNYATPAAGAPTLAQAFSKAANEIWTGWSAVPYANDQIWASQIVPALASGSKQAQELPAFGTDASNLARSDGLQVKNS
jgi:ABC-type glycerol-3-phosphate transport system substrate-binding protein